MTTINLDIRNVVHNSDGTTVTFGRDDTNSTGNVNVPDDTSTDPPTPATRAQIDDFLTALANQLAQENQVGLDVLQVVYSQTVTDPVLGDFTASVRVIRYQSESDGLTLFYRTGSGDVLDLAAGTTPTVADVETQLNQIATDLATALLGAQNLVGAIIHGESG